MEMTVIALFCTAMISATLLNQAGTIAISKNGEYALLNKKTNKKVNIFIRALKESQTLGDRNQPSSGNYMYLETHRRLRRSLTAEEQAKLMTVEVAPSGCSSFACSDGKAVLEAPKRFMPNFTMIDPPPVSNTTDNGTTTIGALSGTITEDPTAEPSSLKEKKNNEQPTSDVTTSTEVNTAESQFASMAHTTPSGKLLKVFSNETNKIVATAKPLVLNSRTSVNEMKTKSLRLSKLAKRIYGKFFHRLEPIVVFRFHVRPRGFKQFLHNSVPNTFSSKPVKPISIPKTFSSKKTIFI